jgi:hypothetical protein
MRAVVRTAIPVRVLKGMRPESVIIFLPSLMWKIVAVNDSRVLAYFDAVRPNGHQQSPTK